MLNKQDRDYKEFLKLKKRLNEIYKLRRNAPLIKLDKPYQKGWYSNITLRDDLARSKKKDFYNLLLEIGYNKKKEIHNPNFVRLIRKGVQFYNPPNKASYNFIPEKKHLSVKKYEELGDNIKHYFHDVFGKYGNHFWYEIYIPNFWIKLRITPKMITHVKEIDPLLEQEKAWIENKIDNNYAYKYYTYRRNRWEDFYRQKQDRKHNNKKLIKKELEDDTDTTP